MCSVAHYRGNLESSTLRSVDRPPWVTTVDNHYTRPVHCKLLCRNISVNMCTAFVVMRNWYGTYRKNGVFSLSFSLSGQETLRIFWSKKQQPGGKKILNERITSYYYRLYVQNDLYTAVLVGTYPTAMTYKIFTIITISKESNDIV